jgi:hypothetical protein
MPDPSVPTFRQCERVYTLASGSRWSAYVALAAAAIIGYTFWHYRTDLVPMASILLIVLIVLLIYAAAVLVKAGGNRAGVYIDGLLVRKWPWPPWYVRWLDITELEDRSGDRVGWGTEAPHGRTLTLTFLDADREHRTRELASVGWPEGASAALEALDALHEEIIRRCELEDAGIVREWREVTVKPSGGRGVVAWTIRAWRRCDAP